MVSCCDADCSNDSTVEYWTPIPNPTSKLPTNSVFRLQRSTSSVPHTDTRMSTLPTTSSGSRHVPSPCSSYWIFYETGLNIPILDRTTHEDPAPASREAKVDCDLRCKILASRSNSMLERLAASTRSTNLRATTNNGRIGAGSCSMATNETVSWDA